MSMACDVKWADERWLQHILNTVSIVSTKLSIFALKHELHVMTWQYCIWPDSNTQRNKKLSWHWQTARRNCTNAM